MRHNHTLLIMLAAAAGLSSPVHAQDMLLPPTPEGDTPQQNLQQTEATEIVTEVKPSEQHLPQAEQRLRKGVVMLHSLLQTMASIKDKDTAESAVPVIMRFSKSFPAWAQSFNVLPPMEEMEQIIYEDQYLPLIEELNKVIKMHAERLAAAEYYGSTHLLTALIHLALINQ